MLCITQDDIYPFGVSICLGFQIPMSNSTSWSGVLGVVNVLLRAFNILSAWHAKVYSVNADYIDFE
jgi:hypothetical protein